MDASFYFVHQDDNSQELDDQIVPSSKLNLAGKNNDSSDYSSTTTIKWKELKMDGFIKDCDKRKVFLNFMPFNYNFACINYLEEINVLFPFTYHKLTDKRFKIMFYVKETELHFYFRTLA
ncbi:UNVERIFIED_CONTAM: hypothetical protein NCL1_16858 [Trichonephila clavipes]